MPATNMHGSREVAQRARVPTIEERMRSWATWRGGGWAVGGIRWERVWVRRTENMPHTRAPHARTTHSHHTRHTRHIHTHTSQSHTHDALAPHAPCRRGSPPAPLLRCSPRKKQTVSCRTGRSSCPRRCPSRPAARRRTRCARRGAPGGGKGRRGEVSSFCGRKAKVKNSAEGWRDDPFHGHRWNGFHG